MVGWSVVCECAWSEVWLGGVWCVSVHGVRVVGWSVVCECAWSEVWLGGVWCVRVHKYGFEMECRTASPSPSVAVTGTLGHTALH